MFCNCFTLKRVEHMLKIAGGYVQNVLEGGYNKTFYVHGVAAGSRRL